MINIGYLGATATVDLTLSEYTTLTGASGTAYVFLLTNAVSGATAVFTSPDISSFPRRYNRFLWTSVASTDVDLQDGKFYLAEPGTYDYVAYSMDNTVPVSLDLTNALEIVEVGRLELTFTDTPIPGWDPPQPAVPQWDPA